MSEPVKKKPDIQLESIHKLASKAYYVTPDMIKFLLVETLALKLYLHEHGQLDIDQFAMAKERAQRILDDKEKEQMEDWFKKNPSFQALVAEVAAQTALSLNSSDEKSSS